MKTSILFLAITLISSLSLMAQSGPIEVEYQASLSVADHSSSKEVNTSVTAAELRQTAASEIRQLVIQKVEYPAIARDYGIEGMVVVEVIVGNSGKIQEYTILKSPHSEFDKAVIQSMKSIKNNQLIQQHQQGALVVHVPLNFRLK